MEMADIQVRGGGGEVLETENGRKATRQFSHSSPCLCVSLPSGVSGNHLHPVVEASFAELGRLLHPS